MSAWPKSILIDSEQFESGEAMSDDFRRIAAQEIDEFKAEYRERYPERDAGKISEEELLREVMNTVGKPGKLGEQIRCVVSVSMLTEGWDANTVTHILGIRAFGTQLLCEQVVGRALRRTSWALDEQGTSISNTPKSTACPSPLSPRRVAVRSQARPNRSPVCARSKTGRRSKCVSRACSVTATISRRRS